MVGLNWCGGAFHPDADSKDEAVDIAGEFLRGNLESGVRMKCSTAPVKSYQLFITGALLLLVSVFAGVASLGYFKTSTIPFSGSGNTSAFQPSLKTGQTGKFKDSWQEEENRKVLEFIKK